MFRLGEQPSTKRYHYRKELLIRSVTLFMLSLLGTFPSLFVPKGVKSGGFLCRKFRKFDNRLRIKNCLLELDILTTVCYMWGDVSLPLH